MRVELGDVGEYLELGGAPTHGAGDEGSVSFESVVADAVEELGADVGGDAGGDFKPDGAVSPADWGAGGVAADLPAKDVDGGVVVVEEGGGDSRGHVGNGDEGLGVLSEVEGGRVSGGKREGRSENELKRARWSPRKSFVSSFGEWEWEMGYCC